MKFKSKRVKLDNWKTNYTKHIFECVFFSFLLMSHSFETISKSSFSRLFKHKRVIIIVMMAQMKTMTMTMMMRITLNKVIQRNSIEFIRVVIDVELQTNGCVSRHEEDRTTTMTRDQNMKRKLDVSQLSASLISC